MALTAYPRENPPKCSANTVANKITDAVPRERNAAFFATTDAHIRVTPITLRSGVTRPTRSTARGANRRSPAPIRSGARTTCMVDPRRAAPSTATRWPARSVIRRGVAMTLAQVDASVIRIDKATFAPPNKHTRFEAVPPGAVATSSKPAVNAESSRATLANMVPKRGMIVNCALAPKSTSSGRSATERNSSVEVDNPIQSIIRHKVPTSKSFVNHENAEGRTTASTAPQRT
mmetsp:Transcript_16144/g.35006  ORF Transcript_16144/g.35006 Transcript_16144/m.35006 type:complete len:232 (+) Transcript_16144:2293-2988(+)